MPETTHMQREEIIHAVHAATAEVFSTMLGMEVKPSATHLDHASPSVIDGIMGVVGVAGPWTGTGVILCSARFARRLCSTLLMTEANAVNEEVLDAVGEIANMIVGNFKTAAEVMVGPLNLSVPTVIYGRNFTSRSLGNSEWIVMPFDCEEERFEVRIWFAPAAQPGLTRHAMHLQVV
jgi:chemotaxis protein CheX